MARIQIDRVRLKRIGLLATNVTHLLIGASSKHLTEFLAAVALAGRRYGMDLHYDKFQLLNIQCDTRVIRPDGVTVDDSCRMVYLGTVISEHGSTDAELNRRIGQAKSDFRVLSKIWNHSNLSTARKLQIFSSMVETRLLYSLACCCFTVAQLRRLNGFQAKCVRQILGIKPSFLSRVSNQEVLRRAHHTNATTQLMQTQLMFLGKVLAAPTTSQLHSSAFIPGTLQPATSRYVRRVGRPRKEWIPTVVAEATKQARSHGWHELQALARDRSQWRTVMSHK